MTLNSLSGEISDTYRQNLKLYANLLESETQKVSTMSFGLATNSFVQKVLNYFAGSKKQDEYTSLLESKELSDILLQNIGYSKYIEHIDLLTNSGRVISSSDLSYLSGQPDISKIIAQAKESDSGPFWCKASEPNCIFEVRNIRSASGDNIDQSIGVLFIWVDLKQLIRSVDANEFFDRNLFYIADGSDVFYTNSTIGFQNIENARMQKSAKVDGVDYIVGDIVSQQNKWDYYIFCPVETIFGPVRAIVKSVVAVYVVVFVLIVLGCGLLSKQIISPLSVLARQMKIVETGNFDIEREGLLRKSGNDEIGSICQDFIVMAEKIQNLIEVDYKNQLVIQETKLKALQAQINPHFLYNVLDTVNWLSKMGKCSEIGILIENLSVLLRSAISNGKIYHTIREEMALVGSYLAIQTVRYGEKLKFYSDVDPELSEYMIPKLLLQPIIENSVSYGLESTGKPCVVNLSIQPDGNGQMLILICDNGPGIPQENIEKILSGDFKPKGNGIGLNNIDNRIKIAFGKEYGLEIKSEPGNGISVSIRIPKRKL